MWDLGHAGVRVPPLYFSPSVSLCEVSIKGSSSGGDTGRQLTTGQIAHSVVGSAPSINPIEARLPALL